MLKAPLELIQEAARSGCSAFRSGGRIDRAPLVAWLRQNASALAESTSNRALRDALLAEQCRKLRLANDRTEGKTVLRSAVCETISRILQTMRSEVERELVHQVPIELGCPDVGGARERLRAAGDKIFAALFTLGDHWKA